MIPASEISLVKPALELADQVREALVESYADHIRFLVWPQPDPSLASVRKNIEQSIINFENNQNEYRFSIIRNSDSRLVGTIGLHIRDLKIPYLEIGYWVRSSESGKGYIVAAVKLIEDYAVKELKVRRLEIRVAESNIRSIRVAERAGFEFEAKLHSDRLLPDGTVENTFVYYKLYS